MIVSQSIAERLFPNGDALNRKFWWTDPLLGKLQRRSEPVPDLDLEPSPVDDAEVGRVARR